MTMTARLRRRAIASAVAALAVAGVIVAVALSNAGQAVPAASATTRVQRGSVSLAVAAAGTIQAARTLGLAFSMAGTVTEVNVKVGDPVKAGQVLARIDPGDAQDAVTSAQSRVDDAQDAVDRAAAAANLPACPTATRTTPPPTTRAPTPTPTMSPSPSLWLSPSPTPTAKPTTSSPAPTAGSASASGDRVGAFGATGVVLAVGPGDGGTQTCASSGRSSTTDSQLSAQQQLNNAKLALTRAKARLAGTTITAPLDGRVLSVGGKVGAQANPGSTGFVVLGDLSDLTVTAQFSEADVGKLAVGQVATIGLPDRAAEVPGKVSLISPAGTVSDRLVRYRVVIAFDQVPADLLLGQSATVTVTTASVDDVLYVASAAVRGVANGQATVTVRAGGRDTPRTVTIGLRGDQYTEISAGLAEGDEVVLPSDDAASAP